MALNATQEALLEGAKALRYRAERLTSLAQSRECGVCEETIGIWRSQAELLDRLSCADIGGIEMSTVDGDA